ncbi:MAG: prolipoprotein diacylglyceryl transferase [Myxococcales bacterium]|nr:prolipoprotein diacylglyceryl transferase [Myxococcales bacterium]
MSGPLIPYIDGASYEIPLSFLKYLPILGELVDPRHPPSIKPFGTLVAIGVYVGAAITLRRARQRGLDERLMNDFIFWVVATGFVLSHMLDAVFYHPDRVARDPMYVLRIWDGLSSYGGFIGALVGGLAWRAYRKKPILEYVELCIGAFPTAWIFGRSGCSIVHDHPGAVSNAWFAVRYPPSELVAGYDGRYDLGLYELVLTIPLACACHYLWHKQPNRANGFYVGVTLTAYAPVRFMLDFLRISPTDAAAVAADPRYAGLTPAQWACFAALGTGVYFLRKTWSAPYVRLGELAPEEPVANEAGADEPGPNEPKPEAPRGD